MSKKLFFRLFVAAIVLGGLTSILTSCGRAAAHQRPPAPAVTVAPVERKEIVEWAEFTGRSEAVESVEVRPRVSGHIQQVRFQSGQMVKKGEVLFLIDPRWYQADHDRRQAELEQATAHLENARREAERTAQLPRLLCWRRKRPWSPPSWISNTPRSARRLMVG